MIFIDSFAFYQGKIKNKQQNKLENFKIRNG